MRILIGLLLISSLLFSSSAKLDERQKLLSVVSGEWLAQGLYCAANLDLATHLASGAKSVVELSNLTKCDKQNLYRLLRMLASHGIFFEEENKRFSNTKISELLSTQHPQSLRSLILFYGQQITDSFKALGECVQQGKTAFQIAHQQSVFEYFKTHPLSAKSFNAAMKEKSKMVIDECLDKYEFTKFSTVYDIGGGAGGFLTALLQKYPHMRGLLFEVPEVIKTVKPQFKAWKERCGLVEGNFFEAIPPHGDAYLLKSILHDWNDEDAIKILQQCHKAMRPTAKLLVVEPLIGEANQKDYAKCMDVLMMVMTGGQERSEEDFRYLLQKANFKVDAIIKTGTEFVMIECSRL